MPDRRRGSVEDLIGYTRHSRHHDHNRLWRLSIVFFVAVAIFGVAYMEDFMDKDLAMSGPFMPPWLLSRLPLTGCPSSRWLASPSLTLSNGSLWRGPTVSLLLCSVFCQESPLFMRRPVGWTAYRQTYLCPMGSRL